MSRRRRKPKIKESVRMHGIADKGRAVGRDEEGMVYFVEGAVPGDVVDVLVKKKKSSFMQGTVHATQTFSDLRIEPFCAHFGECGGCKWQNLSYESQIHFKEQVVRDAFKRLGGISIGEFHPIMGCEQTVGYRNKLEYSFSDKRWVPQSELDSQVEIDWDNACGFHRAGAFNKIVQIEKCHLQEDLSNQIRNHVDKFSKERSWTYYNSKDHKGLLRNLMVRNSTLGEWMILMIFGEDDKPAVEELMNSLVENFSQLTSVFYVINKKLNDTHNDLDYVHFHGQEYITERLGHIDYRIGPKSFFQTNTRQAKQLYDKVLEFAALQGTEKVIDLYTGLGSIALYIADKCERVIGIEEIPQAIEDAKVNMKLNEIRNTAFEVGDCKDAFNSEFLEKFGQPDCIIVDPPRAGLHKDVVNVLNTSGAEKIIYVSCNPSTQARDIALMKENYEIIEMQPVDMFPHTHHIENIASLKRI